MVENLAFFLGGMSVAWNIVYVGNAVIKYLGRKKEVDNET